MVIRSSHNSLTPELENLLETGLGAGDVRAVVFSVVVVGVVVVVGRNLVTLSVGRGVVIVVAGTVDGAIDKDDAAGCVLADCESTDAGVDRLVQLFHHLVDGVELLELVCHHGMVVIKGFEVVVTVVVVALIVVVVALVVVVVGLLVVVVILDVVVVALGVVGLKTCAVDARPPLKNGLGSVAARMVSVRFRKELRPISSA